MQSTIEKLLRRYGRAVTVFRDEESLEFQAFFHHTGSKDWHNMEKAYSKLGQIPRGQYLVIAPVWANLKMGDKLQCGNRRFAIRRVESESLGNEELYSWALCVELGREDVWPI